MSKFKWLRLFTLFYSTLFKDEQYLAIAKER